MGVIWLLRRWYYRRFYLRSAHWRLFRQAWWERHPHAHCAVCGHTGGRMALHHRSYKRLGHELDNDVEAVHFGHCHEVADHKRRLWIARHARTAFLVASLGVLLLSDSPAGATSVAPTSAAPGWYPWSSLDSSAVLLALALLMFAAGCHVGMVLFGRRST